MLQTNKIAASVNILGMVGERIRKARQSQQLSLAQVAVKASISVATLSRIETNKQPLELGLFLILAGVLGISPHSLLGDEDGNAVDGVDPLVSQISGLAPSDRARMWRDLAADHRTRRIGRGAGLRDVAQHVEELVAQIDFLREEIESVRTQVKKRI